RASAGDGGRGRGGRNVDHDAVQLGQSRSRCNPDPKNHRQSCCPIEFLHTDLLVITPPLRHYFFTSPLPCCYIPAQFSAPGIAVGRPLIRVSGTRRRVANPASAPRASGPGPTFGRPRRSVPLLPPARRQS